MERSVQLLPKKIGILCQGFIFNQGTGKRGRQFLFSGLLETCWQASCELTYRKERLLNQILILEGFAQLKPYLLASFFLRILSFFSLTGPLYLFISTCQAEDLSPGSVHYWFDSLVKKLIASCVFQYERVSNSAINPGIRRAFYVISVKA